MGFTSTKSADQKPSAATDPATSPSTEDLIPEPEELLDYLAEHTDQPREQLKHNAADLRNELKILTPVSSYYQLGRQLGINLADVFRTKRREFSIDIANLQPEMNSVDLTATIDQRTPVNTFTRDDGTQGKVCNIILKDDTGRCVLTFWDDTTQYRTQLEQGDTIRLEDGYSKQASEFCQSRFGCSVELRIGDNGNLLRKDGEEWSRVCEN